MPRPTEIIQKEDGALYKRCIKCGQFLPVEMFSLSRRNRYCQRQSWCKECMSSYYRKYTQEKKEILREKNRLRKAKKKDEKMIEEKGIGILLKKMVVDEMDQIKRAENEAIRKFMVSKRAFSRHDGSILEKPLDERQKQTPSYGRKVKKYDKCPKCDIGTIRDYNEYEFICDHCHEIFDKEGL